MPNILNNPDNAFNIQESGSDHQANAYGTGRTIVTFKEGAGEDGIKALRGVGKAKSAVARSSDFENHDVAVEMVSDAKALYLEELGLCILDEEASQATMTSQSAMDASGPLIAAEPEVFVFSTSRAVELYLRGFSAAASKIRDDLLEHGNLDAPAVDDDSRIQAAGFTWGLQSVQADQSSYTGRGIKLAILDTGFDIRHPDFAGRVVSQTSFIAGETAQDGNGHGTHCAGTALGPQSPSGTTQRYGCATEASLYVGKVLSNSGGGTSASVLAGMNWAIANKCEVISMSLGSRGGPFRYYSRAGDRALAANLLIVAAAGNDSLRPGRVAPVGAPANSPSIMSVAAIDSRMRIAPYSNGGTVDIAGPGSDVFSSYPRPRRYATLSGTSMATPHVAGCAAMWAQSNSSLRGNRLWQHLENTARNLSFPAQDVGAGLVQAPL